MVITNVDNDLKFYSSDNELLLRIAAQESLEQIIMIGPDPNPIYGPGIRVGGGLSGDSGNKTEIGRTGLVLPF